MSADILDAVVFPDAIIAVAARGRKAWSTGIAESMGGSEQRNGRRSSPRREFDVGGVARTVATWAEIAALHDVVRGSLYGFLLKDPTDNAATVANGLMRPLPAALSGSLGATGVGYGMPSYRLVKRVTFGGLNHDRDIRKPQSGAVTLYRAGSPVTLGASAGNAGIDTVNGNVTFVADGSSTVSAVTVGASTTVTLSSSIAGLTVGTRMYLAGLTGTHASALNDQSHAITAVSGGGSNVYTLSTNTAGMTITAAGSGYKYPQASEALTWAGSFYVPVRFQDDAIDWSMVAGHALTDSRMLEGPSVVLVEVPVP